MRQRKRVSLGPTLWEKSSLHHPGEEGGEGRVWEDADLVVWDPLNVMSVGHLGRSPKAVGTRI